MYRFRQSPVPDRQHLFVPRRHGNPVACEICGGTQFDPIHDVPQRRQDDVSRPSAHR